MKAPVRIGIIGLGWVSTNRHIPAIRRNPNLQLVGVADRNPDTVRRWASRLGVDGAVASSVDEIPWIDQVEAIDVATSPMSHHGLILSALRRGKHVITEKPFAMCIAQGEELLEAAREFDVRLCVVHNFQFAPATQKLLRDISSGRIGAIRSISAVQWGNPMRRLPAWYEQLPGGLFYDESPHLLYLLRRLVAGELNLHAVDVCESTTANQTPASIDASYRASMPHGQIPVTINCRFEAPLSEWHVAVLGDNGAGILDVFRNIYIYLPNDGAHGARQVVRTSVLATAAHWFQHLTNGPRHLAGRLLYGNETVFELFSEAIKSGVDAPMISGAAAMDVLKMQWDILGFKEGVACR